MKRNPEALDVRGLAVMTTSRLDASGGVFTGSFAKFVAEGQKSAFPFKQKRLYAEDDKRKSAGKKGGEMP